MADTTFREHFQIDLTVVRGAETFLGNLAGVTDPQEKRRIIGRTFIDIFSGEARRLDGEVEMVVDRAIPEKINASVFVEGEFPSVAERIGRIGALSWRQRAVIDTASRTLEVSDLDVGLTDAAGTRFLELRTLRPFNVTADPLGFAVDGGSSNILVATITPLELEQLFPRLLGFNLEGVLPQGEFVGRVEAGGLLLAAEQPLVFRDVTVSWEDALANLLGVRRPVIYFVGGGLVWLAMLGSGVHATLAGILVALTVPARARHGTRSFLHRSRRLIDEFEAIEASAGEASAPILAEPEKHAVVEQLQDTAAKATTPLQLWERAYEYPVALFVLPLFALVNAGIPVEINALPRLLGDPLAVGIILGLVLGKTAGIGLATAALLALGRGRLPKGMQPSHVVGVGLLGGIGFTMSIFIAELGFRGQPDQLLLAKTGILFASVIAGTAGYLCLRFTSRSA